jgi:hypothetical protein
MRLAQICVIALVASTSFAAAQTTKSPKKTPPPAKPLTISGCVARSADADQYTIEDKNGTYRLSGKDVHDFVGQRVQLAGGVIESKKLVISGGLKPSPNVAAQAGAIDPAQAANATAGGLAPTGTVVLPEFRVTTVRPLGAGCQ